MKPCRALIAALAASLLCHLAVAQDGARVKLDIAAQPLGPALMALGEQSSIQVLMKIGSETIEGRSVPRMSGEFTVKEALDRLLSDTGLKYEFVNDRTVRIVAPDAINQAGTTAVHIAQTEEAPAPDAGGQISSSQSATADDDTTFKGFGVGSIPEILVTGSKTLNMDIRRTRDDAQPFVVFDREQIAQSGARTIDEFLRNKLPMASVGLSSNQSSGVFGTASSVNLRGLGENQTLILVDGHRASSITSRGSAQQTDINGIPLPAIERIEVLPTTASGIYGGSATGGVINVILRRDFTGVQTSVGYDGTFSGGGSQRRADVSAGFGSQDGRTTLMLAMSYLDSSPLRTGDRNFAERGRRLILDNNPQAFLGGFMPPAGRTTNICSAMFGFCTASGFFGPEIPLTLRDGTVLNSSVTTVPVGYTGAASDDGAQLAANAGTYNFDLADSAQIDGGASSSLLNESRMKSLIATLQHEFAPGARVFLEVSGSDNASNFQQNSLGTFALPENAPGNPFAGEVLVTTPVFGLSSDNVSILRHRRALAGVAVKLPYEWQGALDYTWDRTRGAISSPPNGLTGLFNGLTASDAIASGAIDVFRDTNPSPVNFQPYLDPAMAARFTPATATLNDAALRISGPTGWRLPGGAVVLSTLLERRRETLGNSAFENPSSFFFEYYPERWQTTGSLYFETRLPFVGPQNAVRGMQSLELTLAARHDRYKTVGTNTLSTPTAPVVRETNEFDSTDPTVSLKFQPLADIMLRASYGTGFTPPAVNQIVPTLTTIDLRPYAGSNPLLRDPKRGNGPIGNAPVVLIGGGSPDLKPEDSKSTAVGFVLTPRFSPQMRLSLDWVRIAKKNNIAAPFSLGLAPTVFDYEDLIPGLVVRGPASDGFDAGPVTALNSLALVNIARLRAEALDMAFDYRIDNAGRFGALTFSAAATHQLKLEQRILPQEPATDRVGLVFSVLDWKGNATLTWDYRQWTAAWTAIYFASHWLGADHLPDINQGSATIPSQTYHDVFVRYRPAAAAGLGILKQIEIQLGIQNVFDKSPPINVGAGNGSFFDAYGDPRLRRYSLSLTTGF